MNKRMLGVIVLVGGVLALVGIFMPWIEAKGWGISISASAWDSVSRATVMGERYERETYTCLAFAGAILILVGAIAAMAYTKAKVMWVLPTIGGILAIIGAAWALSDIETGSILGVSVERGYGIYLTLIGGVMGIVGVFGLGSKAEESDTQVL